MELLGPRIRASSPICPIETIRSRPIRDSGSIPIHAQEPKILNILNWPEVMFSDPAWISLADSLRAHRLAIHPQVRAKLGARDQWVAIRHFLDQVMTRGDRIILSTSAQRARVGSYYFLELAYLARRGLRGVSLSAAIHVMR